MRVEEGMKRLCWVVSALGLILAIIGLILAGVRYTQREERVQAFVEMIGQVEGSFAEASASEGDAIKVRQYLGHQFVRENLGFVRAAIPSEREGSSRIQIIDYVRSYAEREYNVADPLVGALIGVLWFAGVWTLFGALRWIFHGFSDVKK